MKTRLRLVRMRNPYAKMLDCRIGIFLSIIFLSKNSGNEILIFSA